MKNLMFASILIIFGFEAIAQDDLKSDSTVSTYLHVNYNSYKAKDSIVGFILKNIDSSGASNWESKQITEFEKDKKGYFIKVDLPMHVLNTSKQMWCISVSLKSSGNRLDTVRTQYGGVVLSRIKLILKSNPEGAETFLIPNRIWQQKFENVSLSKDDSPIQKFRVNTSSTNTFAWVDQTVFVVVYKLNNKLKTIIHHTKSHSVEPEQTVWINF